MRRSTIDALHEAAGDHPARQHPPATPSTALSTAHAGLLALQRSAGNRAVALLAAARGAGQTVAPAPAVAHGPTIQRKLTAEITHGDVDPVTKMGTWVRAIIPPRPRRGTQPSDLARAATAYLSYLNALSAPAAFVRGHLLNEHLGGSGDEDWNLTVFPNKVTNLDHSIRIERALKAVGGWRYYRVDVSYDKVSMDRVRGMLAKPQRKPGVDYAEIADPTRALGIDVDTAAALTYASHLRARGYRANPESDNDQPAPRGGIFTFDADIPDPLSYHHGWKRKERKGAKHPADRQHVSFKGPQTVTAGGPKTSGSFRPRATPERWRDADNARAAFMVGHSRPPSSSGSGDGADKYWMGAEAFFAGIEQGLSRRDAFGPHSGRSYDHGFQDADAFYSALYPVSPTDDLGKRGTKRPRDADEGKPEPSAVHDDMEVSEADEQVEPSSAVHDDMEVSEADEQIEPPSAVHDEDLEMSDADELDEDERPRKRLRRSSSNE